MFQCNFAHGPQLVDPHNMPELRVALKLYKTTSGLNEGVPNGVNYEVQLSERCQNVTPLLQLSFK